MIVKLLFWLLMAVNVAVLGLFFVLGLAAAPSSRTSPLAVAAFMLVVPGVLLAGTAALFMFAKSPLGRGLALVLAACPLLLAVGAGIWGRLDLMSYLEPSAPGGYAHHRAGPLRELEAAVLRRDEAAVAALARQVGKAQLSTPGRDSSTLLVLALRSLSEQPAKPEVLRALLQAGADPNAGTYELPLTWAILISPKTGPEPVQLLLQAGANPNRSQGGAEPAYFSATAKNVDLAVLRMLLEHGADLTARTSDGGNALTRAASAQNWRAALLLLERGAPWQGTRSPMGLDFRGQVEAHVREHRGDADAQAVLAFLDRHPRR